MNTKTTKKKKTAVKKTAIKKVNTVKLITEKDMRCFGNFTPCPRCFDCQFSSTCFVAMQEKTVAAAKLKKTVKKNNRIVMNSRKISFLAISLFFSDQLIKSVTLLDLITSFDLIAEKTGTIINPKTTFQAFNNLIAKKNQYLENSGYRINSAGNVIYKAGIPEYLINQFA